MCSSFADTGHRSCSRDRHHPPTPFDSLSPVLSLLAPLSPRRFLGRYMPPPQGHYTVSLFGDRDDMPPLCNTASRRTDKRLTNKRIYRQAVQSIIGATESVVASGFNNFRLRSSTCCAPRVPDKPLNIRHIPPRTCPQAHLASRARRRRWASGRGDPWHAIVQRKGVKPKSHRFPNQHGREGPGEAQRARSDRAGCNGALGKRLIRPPPGRASAADSHPTHHEHPTGQADTRL